MSNPVAKDRGPVPRQAVSPWETPGCGQPGAECRAAEGFFDCRFSAGSASVTGLSAGASAVGASGGGGGAICRFGDQCDHALPTGTSSPAEACTFVRKPSACASTSMVVLSVSTSKQNVAGGHRIAGTFLPGNQQAGVLRHAQGRHDDLMRHDKVPRAGNGARAIGHAFCCGYRQIFEHRRKGHRHVPSRARRAALEHRGDRMPFH